MSLIRYKQKRNFKSTSEPEGGKPKSAQLIFVVQKHAASRLHYDFRLEMESVLKSWAVPKGPSTDPAVKRLAMMVEDHPYNYRDFEGSIPEGNYGAGTVIVWDQGYFEPIEEVGDKKEQDKYLLKQLKAGSLKFVLHGNKLKGEWALVRTRQSENSWLLIKHKDKYAKETDITTKTKSVISGKTLEQIEKEMTGTNKSKITSTKTASSKTTKAKATKAEATNRSKKTSTSATVTKSKTTTASPVKKKVSSKTTSSNAR